jgi:hypothetical protein
LLPKYHIQTSDARSAHADISALLSSARRLPSQKNRHGLV